MNQKNLILLLGAICAVAWIVAAIAPVDRAAWALENILLVLFVVILALTYRHLPFSNVAWICLALFVLLHIIGAHYTYARMPLGLWAKEAFDLGRNHYDRLTHGAFGFLLTLPGWELLLRFSRLRRGWALVLAPLIVIAASGVFEIIESTTAEIVSPGSGVVWLGGQGDEWDAQNDMLAAALGATVMALLVWIFGKEPARHD